MIFKNVSTQGVYLFATNADGSPDTGDGPNITAVISKNGAAPVASATPHPTEIGSGLYWLPLSQPETNCDAAALTMSSTTTGVTFDPIIFYPAGSTTRNGAILDPAGLDLVTIEAGLNARQALALVTAAEVGTVTGQAADAPQIAAAGSPGTLRISATTDSSGDRTLITLHPPV